LFNLCIVSLLAQTIQVLIDLIESDITLLNNLRLGFFNFFFIFFDAWIKVSSKFGYQLLLKWPYKEKQMPTWSIKMHISSGGKPALWASQSRHTVHHYLICSLCCLEFISQNTKKIKIKKKERKKSVRFLFDLCIVSLLAQTIEVLIDLKESNITLLNCLWIFFLYFDAWTKVSTKFGNQVLIKWPYKEKQMPSWSIEMHISLGVDLHYKHLKVDTMSIIAWYAHSIALNLSH